MPTDIFSSRQSGVLLHPTSLPGPYLIGDLGREAYAFVDWLVTAGCRWWQILPIVPPGAGNSPYVSTASLAGNPALIDPAPLLEEGFLTQSDLTRLSTAASSRIDFAAVHTHKLGVIQKAAESLVAKPTHPWFVEMERFRFRERWVGEAALFFALKQLHGGAPWWEWPAPLRDRNEKALKDVLDKHRALIDRFCAEQYLFARQWDALKSYANEKGVLILGDVPIYVDWDSVDVWGNRASFQLDANGKPTAVSGVPPDYFSEKGQLWGTPLYRWDVLEKDGYRFWVERLRRALAQTDAIRIDHFRAFSAYWEVPAGAEDARPGKWKPGPKIKLFRELERALGPLPVLAEDLGDIDQDVHDLRDSVGLPGMRILQFAFGDDAANAYLPHNFNDHSVVYTGTHDNDTTLGFWKSAPEKVRDHIRRYCAVDGHDVVWDLIRAALRSVANTAIIPVQDLLKLDASGRMNIPGQTDGNWGWRMQKGALTPDIAERLRGLNVLYGRQEVSDTSGTK